jgi:hypothetical protein
MYNDLQIFQDSLLSHLGPNEHVEADDGYVGEAPKHVKCQQSFVNPEETLHMQQKVHAHHETINKRFKQWGCLDQCFHYDIWKHGDVF